MPSIRSTSSRHCFMAPGEAVGLEGGAAALWPQTAPLAYAVWSGHVSTLDPRLAMTKVQVLFVPEPRDPIVSGLDPTQRGPRPIQGVRFMPVEVLDLTRRSGPYI
jgi:hypothetical protein